MTSQVSSVQNDVAKIISIIQTLKDRLYKLDAIAEERSHDFVERTLRKFSNATGHFGLIDLKGEFIECTSDGRPIAFSKDEQNRPVQLSELTSQPPRSYDDVRTVIADLLRHSLYVGAERSDAMWRAHATIAEINRILLNIDKVNEQNISPECTTRLRELAKSEAKALKAYVE